MERTITLTIALTSPDTFTVSFFDGESGDHVSYPCHDKGTVTAQENQRLAQEIRSWVSIMREDLQDVECLEVE